MDAHCCFTVNVACRHVIRQMGHGHDAPAPHGAAWETEVQGILEKLWVSTLPCAASPGPCQRCAFACMKRLA
jgi:hypothetical protein